MFSSLPSRAETGEVHYKLTIDDPFHVADENRDLIVKNLDAALNDWNRYIDLRNSLWIEIRFRSTKEGRVEGASTGNHVLEIINGFEVLEESATYKLRTGKSVDPSKPDLVIGVNPEYLKKEVWIDPRPFRRNSTIPDNRIDLVSIFEHELAHAFGINGFRDHKTGRLADRYMGVYDQYVVTNKGHFYFDGPNAVRVYGGEIPLTSTVESQNLYHVGNRTDLAASVRGGLMNGIEFNYGHRYRIGPMEVAILKDVGVPLRRQ